jgi:hypothetical protein
VEDSRTGGDEHSVFDGAVDDVGVGTDEAVVADRERVRGVAPQHGVLHHDAFGSDLDRAALRDDLGAEEDAGAGTDDDVSADGRVWRHVGRGVDSRGLALVRDQHGRA